MDQNIKKYLDSLSKMHALMHYNDISQPLTVWKTNADLEQRLPIFTCTNKDIAETVMMKFFIASNCQTDYMLVQDKSQCLVTYLLSDRSKRLRNECLG